MEGYHKIASSPLFFLLPNLEFRLNYGKVDNNMLLDWRDWTFCESVFVGDACSSDNTSSAFEGNLCHLTFDELQCLRKRSSTNSALFNEEVPSCSISTGCGLVREHH